ncbi:Cell wall galactomannoprotein [Ceraceosorus bombacis]|uniref:Cell wall galactomannoprotein n=1 Tax=Ceraceosorus bombacis TaxID=401625 RepID=A0A0P1BD45_9BASI|nr:Cell wall galactomannoprotein [Ceraceosorus bombacis]
MRLLIPFVILSIVLVQGTAAWNPTTRKLEETVGSMNEHIGALLSSFSKYLAGDLSQTGLAIAAVTNLTADLHTAVNDLASPEVEVQGEDVQDILVLLGYASGNVTATVQALVQNQDRMKKSGVDGFVDQLLPPLGRAFKTFSSLVTIQSDKKYRTQLYEATAIIVAWINFGLVAFGNSRVSGDWPVGDVDHPFDPQPCDGYQDKGEECQELQQPQAAA